MIYFVLFLSLNFSFCSSVKLVNEFNYCDENICHRINEIQVYDEVSNCTNDILVQFQLQNEIRFGYLTKELNIINKTFKNNCFNKEVIFCETNNFIITIITKYNFYEK